jgi:hypothetical protein
LPRGAPLPYKDGVETLAQQRLHALHGRVVANLHAHIQDVVDLFAKHLLRQPERRDIGTHQPARLILLFKNRDLIAQRHQIVRHGERSRARARQRDAFAVLSAQALWAADASLHRDVGRHALQTANRNWFAV